MGAAGHDPLRCLLSSGTSTFLSRLCIPSDFRLIQSPSGKNAKVQSTRMGYVTILVLLVHSGWYLSMRFLQVEKARTYSK